MQDIEQQSAVIIYLGIIALTVVIGGLLYRKNKRHNDKIKFKD